MKMGNKLEFIKEKLQEKFQAKLEILDDFIFVTLFIFEEFLYFFKYHNFQTKKNLKLNVIYNYI